MASVATLYSDEDDGSDACSYADDVYDIGKAVEIMRPEFARQREISRIMCDPSYRLSYLARDMCRACLIPLIFSPLLYEHNRAVQRIIKQVELPSIIDDLSSLPFDESNTFVLYSRYADRIRRNKHATTIQCGSFSCFRFKNELYVTQGVNITDRKLIRDENYKYNWFYVGYNTFLWFDTFEGPAEAEIYGYRINEYGRIVEFDCNPYISGILEIDILPCGLAYCEGVEPYAIDEDGYEIDNVDRNLCWKLVDFSVDPPNVLKVERAYGNYKYWDYIDDYGKYQHQPIPVPMYPYERTRSAMWL